LSTLILFIGLALVAAILVDFFGTTLTPRRFHFLATAISAVVWRVLVGLAEATGRPALVTAAGPAIVLIVFGSWLGLTWAAWTIVFSAYPQAVVNDGGEPAAFWERAYFAGYTLSTLGLGELRPGDNLARLLTAAASFGGLVIISLTISSLVGVVQAVTAARTLAVRLTSLGESGAEMLANGWDGESFERLESQLQPLLGALFEHSERGEASPVIHHFIEQDRRRALGPAVAALDDALVLLRDAVAPQARPRGLMLKPFFQAVAAVVPPRLLDREVGPPPAPDPGPLARRGIPLDPAYRPGPCGDPDRARREALAGWLRETGWIWEDRPRPLEARDLAARLR